MNLPTRCCYVKVQGHEAVRITSLKVRQPTVDQKELTLVLGEYKRRYQRSLQEADAIRGKEAAAWQLYAGAVPTDAKHADETAVFHNPFAAQEKETDPN